MTMPTLVSERKVIQWRLPISVKDVDPKAGIVCAYGSSFNIPDDNYPTRDVVKPGAFTKSIQENGPQGSNRTLFLWDHKPDLILGKPSVLKEDAFGLYFESKIVRTSYGADVLMLYEEKVINEHSIGYFVVKSSYGTAGGEKVRFLDQVSLLEISAVAFGMNPITPTVGLKYLDANHLAGQIQRAQRVLQNGHFHSDKIAPLLEQQTQEWKRQLKTMRARIDDTLTRAFEQALQRERKAEQIAEAKADAANWEPGIQIAILRNKAAQSSDPAQKLRYTLEAMQRRIDALAPAEAQSANDDPEAQLLHLLKRWQRV